MNGEEFCGKTGDGRLIGLIFGKGSRGRRRIGMKVGERMEDRERKLLDK